jgi:hypothetical protein
MYSYDLTRYSFWILHCQRENCARPLPPAIGVTLLKTLDRERGTKSTMGIRKFNLQRSQVRKMGKICLIQCLIYKDLGQRAQGIYMASLALSTGDSDASNLRAVKYRYFIFSL